MARHAPSSSEGFTLVELIIALLIAGILAALAIPRMQGTVQEIRARSTLNQLSSELYWARMLAVEGGATVRLVLHSDGDCVRSVSTFRDEPDGGRRELTRATVGSVGPCLRHNGDSSLVFDGRGMLRPPARTFSIENGRVTERLILSIAGRLRRTR
ncbi:MAG: prepilin-type N-terminal cleavage/methylation domain-containing protein [Gemmatimonas sp.]|nr:prepilin-type N-terminal cleavage/methylation domain-containing protein [Gemmatimonas sp.]